ncbi:hypothetical protein F4859DRAFT_457170 [Xylaria cf. heliscus]|nr:hypothetical protein F4859DRAFT_457170 [Xylaria cf. heliscus]
MKVSVAIVHLTATIAVAVAVAIPREAKAGKCPTVSFRLIIGKVQYTNLRNTIVVDPDEAVVYPASVDQSWVDARSVSPDPDEAVMYPASIDQSWVDA